jgi:hypothetical protein
VQPQCSKVEPARSYGFSNTSPDPWLERIKKTERPVAKQYAIFFPNGEKTDVWADSAVVSLDGRLTFYRTVQVPRWEDAPVETVSGLFRERTRYQKVRILVDELETIAVFLPHTYDYYYLVDEDSDYGGIDPDSLVSDGD